MATNAIIPSNESTGHTSSKEMAGPPEPDAVVKLLEILTSPQSHVPPAQPPSLDKLLHDNLRKLEEQLNTSDKNEKLASLLRQRVDRAGSISSSNEAGCPSDVRWAFTCWTVELLQMLKSSIQRVMKPENMPESKNNGADNQEKKAHSSRAPPMSPDTLSFGSQKVVLTGVQFVVCLGMVPYLDVGVGVPLERRSGFANMLQEKPSCQLESSIKKFRLSYCTCALLDCIKHPTLGSLILSRHLGDLLAALCQICYGPNQAGNTTKVECGEISLTTHGYSKQASSDTVDTLKEGEDKSNQPTPFQVGSIETKDMQQHLQELVGHVYPPLIIRELMVLQGGPQKRSAKQDKGPATVLPPAPAWLRKTCSKLLFERLVQPRGIQALIHGMLPPPGTGPTPSGSSDQTAEWKKCDSVAKVIGNCPVPSRKEEYFSKICPQILELVHVEEKALARQNLRVAVATVVVIMSSQAELAQNLLIRPLLGPLQKCLQDAELTLCDETCIVVDEQRIGCCVEDIHHVFVTGCDPQSPLLGCLQEVMHPLFCLYIVVKNTIMAMRTTLEEILMTFLKWADSTDSVACLDLMAFGSVNQGSSNMVWKPMHSCITFILGQDGGIQAVSKTPANSVEDQLVDWPDHADGVLSLLTVSSSMVDLAVQFLLHLLQDLTCIISEQISTDANSERQHAAGNEKVLINLEVRFEKEAKQIRRSLILLHLLAALTEKLGPSCLKQTGQVLQFVKVTLERGAQVLSAPEDELAGVFESETLTMAMGLLTAVMGGETKVSPEDREGMKALLPLLQTIASSHSDGSVVEMATDLRIAIATQGAVWSEVLKKVAEQKTEVKCSSKISETLQTHKHVPSTGTSPVSLNAKKQTKPLIEVISSASTSGGISSSINTETEDANPTLHKQSPPVLKQENLAGNNLTDAKGTGESSELQKGLHELCDPLIPVRGHGLIRLRRLYEKRDKDTVAKSDLLRTIFLENIEHGDSYIYLAAIQGLAALADDRPQEILPILLRKYSDFDMRRGEKNYSAELTLKLGEVLVKTSKALGPMIPSYRDVLLAAMLSGARHSDSLVRASAVSNLGEVCHLLHFSLGPVVQEVFACVSSLVKSDPSVEVRQAAALVTTQLLQGLGQDAFKVLDSVLRDLYRLLKLITSTEKDDVVKLHVQVALQELDAIMKQFLFPAQNLEKQIRVLDPPPKGLL